MSPWESFFSSRSARRRSPIIISELFHSVLGKASRRLLNCPALVVHLLRPHGSTACPSSPPIPHAQSEATRTRRRWGLPNLPSKSHSRRDPPKQSEPDSRRLPTRQHRLSTLRWRWPLKVAAFALRAKA